MRKHQFVKDDCRCSRNATYFRCKFCREVEYKSPRELQRLNNTQATCFSPDAPEVPKKDVFMGLIGGTFDCLAPDYETYMQEFCKINPAACKK